MSAHVHVIVHASSSGVGADQEVQGRKREELAIRPFLVAGTCASSSWAVVL